MEKTSLARTITTPDLDLDLGLLAKERQAIEARLRELKLLQRESLQPRFTWRESSELPLMKMKASLCCVVRAHLRGREHMPNARYPYAGHRSPEAFLRFALETAAKQFPKIMRLSA